MTLTFRLAIINRTRETKNQYAVANSTLKYTKRTLSPSVINLMLEGQCGALRPCNPVLLQAA